MAPRPASSSAAVDDMVAGPGGCVEEFEVWGSKILLEGGSKSSRSGLVAGMLIDIFKPL